MRRDLQADDAVQLAESGKDMVRIISYLDDVSRRKIFNVNVRTKFFYLREVNFFRAMPV